MYLFLLCLIWISVGSEEQTATEASGEIIRTPSVIYQTDYG